MSAVLLISSVLIGLLVGRITHFQLPGNFVEIVLYALIFVVGIDLSKEKIEKRFVKDIALIIVSTVGGTLVFAYILSLFIPLNTLETLMAASGFGWYSLSAVIISSSYSAYVGSISFFANVLRELFAIIITPFAVKKSKYGTISVAGATSMDTLLGVITMYSDRETALISFGHGFIISILVPITVNVFLGFLK
ncbi:MAG TPA: lysine exporter LysO family protein [Fervidobacterium sp.]|nr:lysine exporter LysO family protein [Fervidobacterium sp.]HPV62736.1 lysine exporter LysO family protein [Fervidobacterium sp.]HQQ17704.1 lysine exporter LysO family protein [Fervidobacterium sp.]